MKKSHFARSFAGAAFLAASLAFAAPAPTSTKTATGTLDETKGSTEFLAVGHPSALKVVGKGPAPKGAFSLEEGKLTGIATFDLNAFDTGIKVRNDHMKKKYLETEKYPEAKLKIVKLAVPADAVAGDFTVPSVPFEGLLTLHGVEKPVSGTAELKRTGGALDLAVRFGLKISDFSIATPGYAGITMADEVQVTVKNTAALAAAK